MSRFFGIALSALVGLGAGYFIGNRTPAREDLRIEGQGSSIVFQADSPGSAWLITGNYLSDGTEAPPALSRSRVELARDKTDGVVVFRLQPAFKLSGIEKIPCEPAMCTIPPKPRLGYAAFYALVTE